MNLPVDAFEFSQTASIQLAVGGQQCERWQMALALVFVYWADQKNKNKFSNKVKDYSCL